MTINQKLQVITNDLHKHGIKTGFPPETIQSEIHRRIMKRKQIRRNGEGGMSASAIEDSKGYDEQLLKLLMKYFNKTVDQDSL